MIVFDKSAAFRLDDSSGMLAVVLPGVVVLAVAAVRLAVVAVALGVAAVPATVIVDFAKRELPLLSTL
jgi:hypothetical protein